MRIAPRCLTIPLLCSLGLVLGLDFWLVLYVNDDANHLWAHHSSPDHDTMNHNNEHDQPTRSLDSLPIVPTPTAEIQTDNVAHNIAGLCCGKHGGPSDEIAAEMVYWRDIPSDLHFKSPFSSLSTSLDPKYLTFEPDTSGFNNGRIIMETAVALALAMGRILVLPPKQKIHMINNNNEQDVFSFDDFFYLDHSLSSLEMIDMKEFLKREALTGHLKHKKTGRVSFPRRNRTNWETNWDPTKRKQFAPFWPWLRNVSHTPKWPAQECIAGFASEPGKQGTDRMTRYWKETNATIRSDESRLEEFDGKPTPVDGSPVSRLREQLVNRAGLLLYDEQLQNTKVFHIISDTRIADKLLVHFYAFLFFEDWHQDLWTKRFVRDHLRYRDEIQCAAARVVDAVRQKARENGNRNGEFDSFHVRRGDFGDVCEESIIGAKEMFDNTFDVLTENATIFIATDEMNTTYFDPFRKRYNIHFLDDFQHLISDLHSTRYGMIDQLVASKGRTFIGTFYSTFSGYINRLRGYYSQKDRLEG